MINQGNSYQRVVVDFIMGLVRENETDMANAYFLDGPGGTEKTFVYSCLLLNIDVVAVAWTRITAMLQRNGRIANSLFKQLLNLHEHSVSGLKINSEESKYIKNTKLIIWDKALMVSMQKCTENPRTRSNYWYSNWTSNTSSKN